MKPTMAMISFLYDALYDEADRILRRLNPCHLRAGGRCLKYTCNGCCHGCDYLGKEGCTVRCLPCKLELCDEARTACPEAVRELQPLRNIAGRYGIHWQLRLPKDFVLATLLLDPASHGRASGSSPVKKKAGSPR